MTPTLLGTIPQWGMFGSTVAILTLIVRWQLGLRKLSIAAQQVEVNARQVNNADLADRRDHAADEMAALRENVASLREELHTCEEECRVKIDALREEVWGEKRQRVAEQISFINMILKSVDAPALKTLLAALEQTQQHLLRGLRIPVSSDEDPK